MGKIVEFEYKDVKKLSKGLDRKSKNIDGVFVDVCERAMENTLKEAEKRTPVKTGELKSSWRKDVEKPKRVGKNFSQTATNNAFNEEAAAIDMEGHYASFVEEGHKPVPWRQRTYGVHMLANAEVDTENKLQGIIEDEMKNFFGGLFD